MRVVVLIVSAILIMACAAIYLARTQNTVEQIRGDTTSISGSSDGVVEHTRHTVDKLNKSTGRTKRRADELIQK
jgi:hypothetical protein